MTYAENKARIRAKAKEWQNEAAEQNYSYGELAYFAEYFTRQGKRYGLLREFRENGII